MKLHGGLLSVWSAGAGKGTTCTIMLPIEGNTTPSVLSRTQKQLNTSPSTNTLLRKDESDVKLHPSFPTKSSHSKFQYKKLKLLVVDDAASNRKFLCRLLKDRSESCVEAVDGLDAIDKVKKSLLSGVIFDVITMDYQMPNMDGPTATRCIRELGYDGVIIGITGNSLPDDISLFIESGANTVLTKPLDMNFYDTFVAQIMKKREEF